MWVKGQRCGVDNCPSRFWQQREGQRVCQNGHVREGIETAADDGDFVLGSRITRPRIEVVREAEDVGLSGKNASNLQLQCLQELLRAQVAFLVKWGAPPQLEKVAKEIWRTHVSQCVKSSALALSITDTIGILMVALRQMQVPIFAFDVQRLIASYELPYMNMLGHLPKHLTSQLPAFYLSSMRPGSLPLSSRLYYSMDKVQRSLRRADPEFRMAPLLVESFMLKLVRDLLLPPAVFGAARRLFGILKLSSKWPHRLRSFDIPEIRAASCVVIAMRLLCMSPIGTGFDSPNWLLWPDVVRKLYLTPGWAQTDERAPLYWDEKTAAKYIAWFGESFITETKKLATVPGQRLLKAFPMPDIPSYVCESVDQETLAELGELVYTPAEIESPYSAGTKSLKPVQGSVEIDPTKPGSLYFSYSRRDDVDSELPKCTDVLYSTICQILGVESLALRKAVQTMEIRLRRDSIKIYQFLEERNLLAWTLPSSEHGTLYRKRVPL